MSDQKSRAKQEMDREFREAKKRGQKFLEAYTRLQKNEDFQLYLGHLGSLSNSRGSEWLNTPTTGLDGLINSLETKGTIYGLQLALGIVAHTIAMEQAQSAVEENSNAAN